MRRDGRPSRGRHMTSEGVSAAPCLHQYLRLIGWCVWGNTALVDFLIAGKCPKLLPEAGGLKPSSECFSVLWKDAFPPPARPLSLSSGSLFWSDILEDFPGQTTRLCSIGFTNRSLIINVWRGVCAVKLFYRSTHHFCYYRWWVIGYPIMWWGKQAALLTSHFDLCPLQLQEPFSAHACLYTSSLPVTLFLFSGLISNKDYICLAGWLIISKLHQPFSFTNLNQ